MLFTASACAAQGSDLMVGQNLWNQFTPGEQATLLGKFPTLELHMPDTVGLIQAVQTVNRSTAGSNTGAMLGGAIGGAAYIDRAFSGNNNYSAITQIGATLLGAAVGSLADRAPQARFEFNYAVKTLDGELREVRNSSGDEFARPVGQCVLLPSLTPVASITCSTDKQTFLKALSASVAQQPADRFAQPEATQTVTCIIAAVGVMTLNRKACQEIGGIEQ
jgi:outer membrane lipoprotein SlyB